MEARHAFVVVVEWRSIRQNLNKLNLNITIPHSYRNNLLTPSRETNALKWSATYIMADPSFKRGVASVGGFLVLNGRL